ncbi:MAG: hypothetical protein DESF_00327 [Desulfovibrio sp.]
MTLLNARAWCEARASAALRPCSAFEKLLCQLLRQEAVSPEKTAHFNLEQINFEMLAYGRQKPAFSHFVARIFKKILAEQLAHFIR